MADSKKRSISEEFYSILSPKDCGRFSKTGKSHYEEAISKIEHTLRSLERKYNNEEYTQYQPEVDDKVLGYYESIIGAFKTAVRNFVSTGKWEYNAPSTSQTTKDKFIAFMDADSKHGSYFDGRPEIVNPIFEKAVKNLIKSGFSANALSDKKKEEEEAKKPKMPETVSYERFTSYDYNRMINYKTNSRGESMAQSSFLTNRGREMQYSKQYPQYPEIAEYVNKLFTAFDNVWFSYVSGTTPSLDFTETDNIYKEYTTKYSTVRQFDSKVCSARMVVSGSFTYWDCKNAMQKMAAAREKVIKTVTMKKEDTYSLWEKSVDSILNDEGKPSLNAFLDNWVEEITAYYTNKDNIKRWKDTDARLDKEIKKYSEQIDKIASDWREAHKNDITTNWRIAREGYMSTREYTEASFNREQAKKSKSSNSRDLSIANMGETKIRAMFKEQAAAVKKSFVTSVCERAGVLKDGVFYWSVQQTGHLNGTVTGQDGKKWKITSFFAGGYNIQKLHTRTKITELVR